MFYQALRKLLGEWLAHFRGSPPSCNGPGPELRYPLSSMKEPPVLACVVGDQNGGSLRLVNNRGFYLSVEPTRGLEIHDVVVSGVLDKVTSAGGAVIRALAQWHSLPLPPGATADFTYRAVPGGPALSFRPDAPATFISGVLSLFAGISDPGDLLLRALSCAHSLGYGGSSELGGCVADALAATADKQWTGPGSQPIPNGRAVRRPPLPPRRRRTQRRLASAAWTSNATARTDGVCTRCYASPTRTGGDAAGTAGRISRSAWTMRAFSNTAPAPARVTARSTTQTPGSATGRNDIDPA